MSLFGKFRLLLLLFALSMLGVACGKIESEPVDRVEPLSGTSRLSELLGAGVTDGYALAMEPRQFAFPEDHGPHDNFRNEWWYVTGNLDGHGGERFGYELTFFRFALGAPAESGNSDTKSLWKANQIYIAHFAVTDPARGDFHVAQRYARGSVGLAGAQAEPFRVWLDDWFLAVAGPDENSNRWKLQAHDGNVSLDLSLESQKPPVLNGQAGLSQKSAEPGNASYYYSLTRLKTNGLLRVDEQTYTVDGWSWLDREWSSSALSQEQIGWDWFALQLSDGSELMYYHIRRNDGSADSHSGGTWTDADGVASHLDKEDVSLVVLDDWTNDEGDDYPASWQLMVRQLDATLNVKPVMANQELVTNVRYWEGAVDVTGMAGGKEINGRGYVELTGYAE